MKTKREHRIGCSALSPSCGSVIIEIRNDTRKRADEKISPAAFGAYSLFLGAVKPGVGAGMRIGGSEVSPGSKGKRFSEAGGGASNGVQYSSTCTRRNS